MSDSFRFRRDVEVRFRDIDEMGHAHHTLPLIYIEEARSAYWREVLGRDELDFIVGDLSMRYHSRIRYPSTVVVGVRTTRIGSSSFEMAYDVHDAGGVLLADGSSRNVMFDYAAGVSKPVPQSMRARIAEYEPAVVEGAAVESTAAGNAAATGPDDQPSSAVTPTSARPTTAPST